MTPSRKIWFSSTNKISTWSLNFCKRYYTSKNRAIWLVKNIFVNNSQTRILPEMGFTMESQVLKELSFCLIFISNGNNFKKKKKMQNIQIWAKIKFTQKSGSIIFSILQKKTNELILRKALNWKKTTRWNYRTYLVKLVCPKSLIQYYFTLVSNVVDDGIAFVYLFKTFQKRWKNIGPNI